MPHVSHGRRRRRAGDYAWRAGLEDSQDAAVHDRGDVQAGAPGDVVGGSAEDQGDRGNDREAGKCRCGEAPAAEPHVWCGLVGERFRRRFIVWCLDRRMDRGGSLAPEVVRREAGGVGLELGRGWWRVAEWD
jgi:hypothetical protein